MYYIYLLIGLQTQLWNFLSSEIVIASEPVVVVEEVAEEKEAPSSKVEYACTSCQKAKKSNTHKSSDFEDEYEDFVLIDEFEPFHDE